MKSYYKNLGFNVCGSIVLFSVSSLATLNAREICYVSGETCSLSYNTAGYYYERVCKPIVSCQTIPDPVPSPSSPAQPSPNPPTPIKTTEEIEREQHEKFCKEFPARISGAVDQCINQAMEYHSYFISTQCPKEHEVTWTLGISIKDAVDAGYSKTFTPNATCREESLASRDFYVDACNLSGNAYRSALAQNCADVN